MIFPQQICCILLGYISNCFSSICHLKHTRQQNKYHVLFNSLVISAFALLDHIKANAIFRVSYVDHNSPIDHWI